VDLLPETSNEMSSIMYRSHEAIFKAKQAGISLLSQQCEEDEMNTSDEEGKLHMDECSRIFLSETASKNKLALGSCGLSAAPSFVRVPQKISDSSVPDISNASSFIGATTNFAMVAYPDTRSPLLRKFVLYGEVKGATLKLQLRSSCTGTGFNCAPNLMFSNVADRNKAYIQPTGKPDMFIDNPVAFSIGKIEVAIFSCGFEHSAVVTRTGEIWTWGYGPSGCLG
jgi:hypothetical protein